MNSENPRVLRKIASLIANLASLKSLDNPLLLAVEGFGDLSNLQFSEEWVKRIHIPKKEGYQNRNWFKRIHPKSANYSIFLVNIISSCSSVH